MYNLSYFKEPDRKVMLQFMQDHPFAFLTGSARDGKPVATQVPLLVSEVNGKLVIRGHIMRNTDHHKAMVDNPNVLAVFTGPHAYVSATWYTNNKMASTWNYMHVHIRGKIRFLPQEDLIALLKDLTLHFEEGKHTSPTVYDNLPDEFIDRMLPAIVAFEIEVEEIDNVFKLSQNRDEASYRNIITRLKARGSEELAGEMEKRLPDLFPPGKEWDATKFLS